MRHSNEQIIEMLKNLAGNLGKQSLSKGDVASVIPVSTVTSRFGSIGNALEAAGLTRTEPGANFRGQGCKINDHELFQALLELEGQIGHEPGFNECSAHNKYSVMPYKQRFGKWPDVIAFYRKWKLEKKPVLPTISSQDSEHADKEAPEYRCVDTTAFPDTVSPVGANKKKVPQQFYGEPLDFRGLRHAPINEQGVVFLFGMVSRELGFNIESVQQGFPDCEGKYLYDMKKNIWAKARIEFEYKASNFQQHGHDHNQCDFIVCRLNDWLDCPITVIDLRTEILKLRP
jgi:hypothetical protein